MTAVHVQRHADAAVGSALREVERLLPEGWYLMVTRAPWATWSASAGSLFGGEGTTRQAEEPAVALRLLADALEAL